MKGKLSHVENILMLVKRKFNDDERKLLLM